MSSEALSGLVDALKWASQGEPVKGHEEPVDEQLRPLLALLADIVDEARSNQSRREREDEMEDDL